MNSITDNVENIEIEKITKLLKEQQFSEAVIEIMKHICVPQK